MFVGIESFGRHLLLSIFILACTVMAARVSFGWKSKSSKDAAIVGVLCLLVGLQYYYLLDVVTFIPASRFYTYNPELVRADCERSNKGGKRVLGSTQVFDMNPCYCNTNVAHCINTATGAIVSSTCPIDSSHECRYFNNGTKIEAYLSSERNCKGGQGTKCTMDEPCFPCEINAVMRFHSERCRTCSTDFTGECNFVPGVGPYCFDKPDSKKVVPCKKCCTEATPVVLNGTCY